MDKREGQVKTVYAAMLAIRDLVEAAGSGKLDEALNAGGFRGMTNGRLENAKVDVLHDNRFLLTVGPKAFIVRVEEAVPEGE